MVEELSSEVKSSQVKSSQAGPGQARPRVGEEPSSQAEDTCCPEACQLHAAADGALPDMGYPLHRLGRLSILSEITGLRAPVLALLQRVRVQSADAAGFVCAAAAPTSLQASSASSTAPSAEWTVPAVEASPAPFATAHCVHLIIYAGDASPLPELRGAIPLTDQTGLSTPTVSRIHLRTAAADDTEVREGRGRRSRLFEIEAPTKDAATGWMLALAHHLHYHASERRRTTPPDGADDASADLGADLGAVRASPPPAATWASRPSVSSLGAAQSTSPPAEPTPPEPPGQRGSVHAIPGAQAAPIPHVVAAGDEDEDEEEQEERASPPPSTVEEAESAASSFFGAERFGTMSKRGEVVTQWPSTSPLAHRTCPCPCACTCTCTCTCTCAVRWAELPPNPDPNPKPSPDPSPSPSPSPDPKVDWPLAWLSPELKRLEIASCSSPGPRRAAWLGGRNDGLLSSRTGCSTLVESLSWKVSLPEPARACQSPPLCPHLDLFTLWPG